MEKYQEKREPCYLAFLDLEKVYDRLLRPVLWKALRGRGSFIHVLHDSDRARMITVIKDMYEGLKAAMWTPH